MCEEVTEGEEDEGVWECGRGLPAILTNLISLRPDYK